MKNRESKMFKYAFFDLDGTLTQSEFGIINSIIYALDKMGKDKAAAMFNHDHTHTSLAGAQLNCQSLAKGLKAIKSPLRKCLK